MAAQPRLSSRSASATQHPDCRTRHESAFVKSRPGRRRRKSRPVSRRRIGRRSSGVTSTCGPMLLGTPPPTPHNPMLDTNGDGRITRPWNVAAGRGQTAPPAFNAALDTEVRYNLYLIIPSPVDYAIWGASEQYPGFIVRVDRGSNPPSTCKTEVYRVPDPGLDHAHRHRLQRRCLDRACREHGERQVRSVASPRVPHRPRVRAQDRGRIPQGRGISVPRHR